MIFSAAFSDCQTSPNPYGTLQVRIGSRVDLHGLVEADGAREFLLRALPLAQEAERLRGAAEVTHDDRLEGRIAALLLQLPDDTDPPAP